MLQAIQKMLPNEHTKIIDTLYFITNTKEMRSKVQYNGVLDQFEIPISVLDFDELEKTYYTRMIPDTCIFYYMTAPESTREDQKLCFGIKIF